jgi:D-xylose transport system substrate-binding protein
MQFQSRRFLVASVICLTALASMLAGCGSSGGGAAGPKGCKKVGVLLPESASSSRWEGKDHPALQSALSAAGFTQIDISNAGGDDNTQISQAETDLTKGDCILILAPHDAAKSAAIVQKAHAQHVPVIAYDRLVADPDLDYYVSFDGKQVGAKQGQYIADHYKDSQYGVSAGHNNIVFINGAQTDNNAILFHDGAHSVLDSLISSGELKNTFETYTPDWKASEAQTEMENALDKAKNNVQVAYVANDDMAATVIAALDAQHLVGKVLVTGQDATATGIQRILSGTQTMTIYKPVKKEAQAAADLAKALSDGTDPKAVASATIENQGKNTPSALLEVTAVEKSNVKSTVIADGYVTQTEACTNVPAGAAPDVCG